jgi:hypothetical protein
MREERKRERGGRREKERERENRMEEREPFNRRSFSVFFFLLTSLFPSRHEKKTQKQNSNDHGLQLAAPVD